MKSDMREALESLSDDNELDLSIGENSPLSVSDEMDDETVCALEDFCDLLDGVRDITDRSLNVRVANMQLNVLRMSEGLESFGISEGFVAKDSADIGFVVDMIRGCIENQSGVEDFGLEADEKKSLWEKIKEFLKKAMEWMRGLVESFKKKVGEFWNKITGASKKLPNKLPDETPHETVLKEKINQTEKEIKKAESKIKADASDSEAVAVKEKLDDEVAILKDKLSQSTSTVYTYKKKSDNMSLRVVRPDGKVLLSEAEYVIKQVEKFMWDIDGANNDLRTAINTLSNTSPAELAKGRETITKFVTDKLEKITNGAFVKPHLPDTFIKSAGFGWPIFLSDNGVFRKFDKHPVEQVPEYKSEYEFSRKELGDFYERARAAEQAILNKAKSLSGKLEGQGDRAFDNIKLLNDIIDDLSKNPDSGASITVIKSINRFNNRIQDICQDLAAMVLMIASNATRDTASLYELYTRYANDKTMVDEAIARHAPSTESYSEIYHIQSLAAVSSFNNIDRAMRVLDYLESR